MSKQAIQKPKLLILSPRFPYPLDKGDRLRLYHQMKGLADDFRICLVALTDETIAKESLEAVDTYTESIHVLRQSPLRNGVALANSLLKSKSVQLSYYYQPSLQREIDRICEAEKPDLIYVQLIRMAPYVRNASVPCYLDYMDAMSLNMERESSYHTGLMRWIYQRESDLLARSELGYSEKFRGKSIISAQDKTYLKGLGVKGLDVVGNGVDLSYFSQEEVEGSEPIYDLVFVGNMGYLPNIEAAEYLVNNICGNREHWKVLIAGSRPHKRVQRLASQNIVVSGWVSDIRTAYGSGKILVAPIFSGAGQQNKILEAMALSQVCISTLQVAEALGARHEEHLYIAETPEDFQVLIDMLLKNPELRKTVGKNARIFVEKNFHWKAQVEKLKNALLSIIQKDKK